MDVDPPRRVRDACYRRESGVVVPVSAEAVSDSTINLPELARIAAQANGGTVSRKRWPYRAVGPVRDMQFYDEVVINNYPDILVTPAFRFTRDWVEPMWGHQPVLETERR